MSEKNDMTIEYYNSHAEEYVEDTLEADMSATRERFLAFVPDGGSILDFGCGSGRDAKAFLDAGYQVVALDGSKELCERAHRLTGLPVICCSFQDYWAMTQYDGIWACASLLHLTEDELSPVMEQLVKSLKPGGALYMSFKYGDYSGERNGRWFTDMTEEKLLSLLVCFHQLRLLEQWQTIDVRQDREEVWINANCIRL